MGRAVRGADPRTVRVRLTPVRILFDPGVYDLRNKGNVALLQVAVRRIHQLWPDATLRVITSAPQILRLYCPEAEPIAPDGSAPGGRVATSLRRLPRPTLRLLLEIREGLSRRRAEDRHRGGPSSEAVPDGEGARRGVAAGLLDGIELFVVTGAQFMSDACRDDALAVFDRLEAAFERGIATVMVGQGVGPFEDPALRARASAVYPLVDVILVRDRVTAPALLSSLGVSPPKVVFTGDDAIELAYRERSVKIGHAIGASLRQSHYTLFGDRDVAVLRDVLDSGRARFSASVVPIPISYSRHELDGQVLGALVDRSERLNLPRPFAQPVDLIRRIGNCRLVVTGTFHTAVFALGQGIPAIGVARTPMYLDKFRSLRDQFGAGCQVISLDEDDVRDRLEAAVETAWRRSEDLRQPLLDAAERQVALGRGGYRQVYEVVESRSSGSKVEHSESRVAN